jgi:hypothetical protein
MQGESSQKGKKLAKTYEFVEKKNLIYKTFEAFGQYLT